MNSYRYILLIFVAVLFGSSCFIKMMPDKMEDDGSSSLTHEDSSLLRNFSADHFNLIQNYESQNRKLFFEEITSEEIKKIIPSNHFTWIMTWATWCPHCYIDFPNAVRLKNRFQGKGINFISVCQDYNLKVMTKELVEASYYEQSYILSARKYGKDEWKKLSEFRKEICPACPSINGTPQHFIFNQEGKLLYYHFGEMRNGDTLLKIF